MRHIFILLLFVSPWAWAGAGAEEVRFSLQSIGGEPARELKTFTFAELAALKPKASSERDPQGGAVVEWKGSLLSEAVDAALAPLSPKVRADIDVLLLTGQDGRKVWLPRAFVVKYPILLARAKGGQTLPPHLSPRLVLPWTSKPKIQQEGMALEAFFLEGVRSVEFGNARERFGRLRLKRRMDPTAMKGERYFISNCVGCHTPAATAPDTVLSVLTDESRLKHLENGGHPAVPFAPALKPADRRPLLSYLNALRLEATAQAKD